MKFGKLEIHQSVLIALIICIFLFLLIERVISCFETLA